ncbi:MAG: glutamate synthase large subunit [Rhodospirillales bacterium]|nr:glutamate synthase large subunit [Rhodospirillales bacterium]
MSSHVSDRHAESGEEFVRRWLENARHLERHGLYDPAFEHDACGVGLVAATDGKPSRRVVEAGIKALKKVWHRGAVDADGKTGDGAGIHVRVPEDFFKEHIRATGHEPGDARLAVGMVFLPKTDLGAQERCRTIVETEVLKGGYVIYGWRQVPVNVEVIGEKANATRPEIEQIMIANPPGSEKSAMTDEQFETDLFIIRRRIEKQVLANYITDFYICSLSCRSVIYKGMFLAEQLTAFYPDLLDERFISSFCIYHQRYSTNTFPTWRLAQPFRMLAHNGEINTLTGNVNWMRSHEPKMASPVFGDDIEDIKPVIQAGGSDSAALDAVFELLVRAGRPVPAVKALMIPESIGAPEVMAENHLSLFSYCNSVLEPWDGPAAICAGDGRWVIAGMDRNGLRPMRYSLTRDNLLVVGSETGMIEIPEQEIVEKGRVGPGGMIGVDLEAGRLYRDRELKDVMAARQPYGEWVKNITVLDGVVKARPKTRALFGAEELRRRQVCFGYSMEDIELILQPMVEGALEAVGSMGDDAPLAVLSDHYRGLHHFFRQAFSQVTNPAIDSIRETGVMSLKTRLGNLGNILEEDPSQCDLLQLPSPVLSTGAFEVLRKTLGDKAAEIDCTFDPQGGRGALGRALMRIRREAEEAVRGGKQHLILSDINVGRDRAPVPMILAAGGVHTHLVQQELRTFTSLNVRSAECVDVHFFAVLIGVGATTVNAYLAEATIVDRHRRGLYGKMPLDACIENYIKATDKGLLKIMSKMGISIVSSYRGGYCFEAVGLSRALVAEFFPGMSSRISGIGLTGIKAKVRAMHKRAFLEEPVPLALPVGGFYKYRASGERHGHDGRLIHILQSAVTQESYSIFKKFSAGVHALQPIFLRDLLDFKRLRDPIPVEEVESITEIRKHLVSPGISYGARSKEAHETLTIAMNRIGAKSDSGEGGEDPLRYHPRPNGDNPSSAIKQIASGRFGVTAEYLNNCREIEIKISQGSKPGEGGQLPGHKVSVEIARLRHSTPGVMLISPQPHHDIYSIEDIAQLIYDLKQINPDAKVCVKLVARSGVGTVAAGVAKAKADVILISGHDGGTGASPQSSIKYAGLPWEMGLSETNQVLTLNRLRHKVKLRVDGGIKTGRDVVIAAMLGADEFGIGTTSLVAMGCILVRQCHSNTCPVGVCTQNPKLREKFTGTPEKVVNLFTFVAEEVSEILASLGVRSLQEITGRSDLLNQVSRGDSNLDDLDLNSLLAQADPGGFPRHYAVEGRTEVPDTLDARIIGDAVQTLEHGEKMQLTYTVRNTHRAVGARVSSMITRRYGMEGLAPGHLTVRLRGSAGQSLGAFAVQGLTLEVLGDANDYVGKGLSGGIIVLRPPVSSPLESHNNTIIGNVVLYGATAGRLFASGLAGDRFCVRNSGAQAVVEGCGSNGCEYMTGGVAVILGPVGQNFGAGMTGGMAFVHDEHDRFRHRVNPDSVVWQRIETGYWEDVVKVLVQQHVKRTHSRFALRLLNDWELEVGKFWQVVPKEMLGKLEHPTTVAEERALKSAGE